MANTYLERNMTGNTASTKMTYSGWIKFCNTSNDGRIFGAQALACHTYFYESKLNVDFSAKDSGTVSAKLQTNRLFRDTNAWYHIVFTLDTTQATADDRIKLYINGVQETSFSTRTNPSLNATYAYGQSGYYSVGARTSNQGSAGHYFNGVMSHVHYTDGYAYDATAFGEYDANGVWTINTSPSVTYGTNGFFILKDGNSVTDQSPNTNNFTVGGGTLTNTEDNPSNVFATLNPLKFTGGTLSNGNLQLDSSSNSWKTRYSTLGVSDGKYYMEFKMGSVTGDQSAVSIVSDNTLDGNAPGVDANASPAITYLSNGTKLVNGTASSSYFSAMSSNDIIGIALDIDGGTVQFYKNGSTTGSAINLSDAFTSSNYPLFFCGNVFNTRNIQANFGNGYFGTTAVSSAGTNASGIGIFEYDVPTGGYTALSTKGLNL